MIGVPYLVMPISRAAWTTKTGAEGWCHRRRKDLPRSLVGCVPAIASIGADGRAAVSSSAANGSMVSAVAAATASNPRLGDVTSQVSFAWSTNSSAVAGSPYSYHCLYHQHSGTVRVQ